MSMENMTEDQRNSLALKRLFNHPEVGLEAKRLYKKAVPDANFPDLDMDDRIKGATKPLTDQIRALEEQAAERNLAQTRRENHAKVTAAGLDPQKVEELMVSERIGSYDTAIKFMTQANRLAPPTPASMTPIQMPDNAKEIAKNPGAWAREQAHAAINELRANRGVV